MAGKQAVLWGHVSSALAVLRDYGNRLGPYAPEEERAAIMRHFDCGNYSACLDYAAEKRWSSFTCYGCRKTQAPIILGVTDGSTSTS